MITKYSLKSCVNSYASYITLETSFIVRERDYPGDLDGHASINIEK